MRALLMCVLLLCVGPLFAAHAESDALAKDPITGLTAEKAVELGANRFVDLYGEKTQDETTIGMCGAALTYAQLRRYINDCATVKRTKKQQALIMTVRSCCIEIMTAYINVDEASSGGGTIHRVEWASGMIEVETTLGKVILSMEKPKPDPQGRRAAAKIFTALIANLHKLPTAYADDPESRNSWREQHDEAMRQLRAALPKLYRLLQALPDNSCSSLARFTSAASKVVE
ncbi:MAG TPA: hypothetical protein VGL77_18170 [Armatimonadota bacterium]|jgi:hypothetical protein